VAPYEPRLWHDADMSPMASRTRDRGLSSGGFNGIVLAQKFHELWGHAAKEAASISERALIELRRGIDVALLHLRARRIFSDPETRRWADEARRSVAAGHVTGLGGDKLRQVLEERREQAIIAAYRRLPPGDRL